MNSLRKIERVTLSSKRRKFDTASVNILSYECEIWRVGYRLRKKSLNTEVGFWRRDEKSKILNIENN
jgi:hypothetical protein